MNRHNLRYVHPTSPVHPDPDHGATRTTLAVLAILLFVQTPQRVRADDWPCFRGPSHDGASPVKLPALDWAKNPKVLWRRTLGRAFSSFAVVGNRLYTCGEEDQRQVLLCLHADTGEIIWKRPFEREITDPDPNLFGTRSTPTVDSGRVYIVGGHETLLCCDADTGSELWNLKLDGRPHWGYAGSVLIEGDKAIFQAGGSRGSLCAVNKSNGEPIWKSGTAHTAYATPLPFSFRDARYVCAVMANSAIVVEVGSGRQVLEIPRPSHEGVNVAMPIYHEGHLFLSTGYGHGCAVYRLETKNGGLDAEEVWSNKALKNKFQTPVLYDGNLYSCDEISLKCVEFLTGKTHWRKGGSLSRGYAHGTVTLADGHLIILSAKGELQIARATPDGFTPLVKSKILDGRCWTVPVLINNRMYARSNTEAVCISVAE